MTGLKILNPDSVGLNIYVAPKLIAIGYSKLSDVPRLIEVEYTCEDCHYIRKIFTKGKIGQNCLFTRRLICICLFHWSSFPLVEFRFTN